MVYTVVQSHVVPMTFIIISDYTPLQNYQFKKRLLVIISYYRYLAIKYASAKFSLIYTWTFELVMHHAS